MKKNFGMSEIDAAGQPVRHGQFSGEAALARDETLDALFGGGHVNHHGTHYDVESARLWDLPDDPPPLGIAVAREGIPWPLVDKGNGEFDFSCIDSSV